METITQWISHYGYFGIFFLLLLGIVGLPVPDEWLLTFTGFLVYKQTLRLAPALVSAILGSCCGITVSYLIGRTLGIYVVKKYGAALHITQERLDRTHRLLERVGTWALLVGYFIPGVRHLTAIVAGTSKLRLVTFGAFAYTGACLWVITFVSIGHAFGDKWSDVLDQIQSHLDDALWIAAVIVVIYLFLQYWLRRRKTAR